MLVLLLLRRFAVIAVLVLLVTVAICGLGHCLTEPETIKQTAGEIASVKIGML